MNRLLILLAICFSAQSYAASLNAYVYRCGGNSNVLLGIIVSESSATQKVRTICPAQVIKDFNSANRSSDERKQILERCDSPQGEAIISCYWNQFVPNCVSENRVSRDGVNCATYIAQPQRQQIQQQPRYNQPGGYQQPQPGYQQPQPGYQQPGYPNYQNYPNQQQLPVPPYQQQRISDSGSVDAAA